MTITKDSISHAIDVVRDIPDSEKSVSIIVGNIPSATLMYPRNSEFPEELVSDLESLRIDYEQFLEDPSFQGNENAENRKARAVVLENKYRELRSKHLTTNHIF